MDIPTTSAKSWVVVHEIGAPSHYAALRYALQQTGESLDFVEFNFWSQAKAIVRRRRTGQWAKTLNNALRLAKFAVTGARGHQVVLGLAPYNPWIILVRWLLRNAIVHLHSSWPYWDGSKQPHPPLIPAVTALWQKFLSQELRHVLIATHLAKSNLEASRYSGAPVTVVAHSFDSHVFFPGPSPECAPRRMIFVGRLEPSKGVDLMLRIAEKRPTTEMVFIGSGPLSDHVEAAAARLPNVRYLGQISDRNRLADELRASDVLLLPSIRVETWEELFGMVLIEAMACGVVPLTTDHVGPVEIMGERLSALCFSESGFVDGVCGQLDRWDLCPRELTQIRQVCIDMASIYTVERIAQRWSRALGFERAQTDETCAMHATAAGIKS